MSSPVDPATARYRTSHDYDLEPLEGGELDRRRPAELDGVTDASEIAAILRPRQFGLLPKALSSEAADLIGRFREPRLLDGEPEQIVLRLVLDGLMEAEIDGAFLSGCVAHQRLLPAGAVWRERILHSPHAARDDELARLTRSALEYGYLRAAADPLFLARRLYLFNRRPCTHAWATRLSSPERILAYVADAATSERLEDSWEMLNRVQSSGWLSWRHTRPLRFVDRRIYKLYVSPQLEDLPSTFHQVVRVLTAHRVARFKLGGTVHGLLRPDKCVAYFGDRGALLAAADALAEKLGSIRVHGVPFTASLEDSGVLSWGIDPPSTNEQGGSELASWRLWVAQRVAVSLMRARASRLEMDDAIRYTKDRLGLEGVQAETWAPCDDIYLDRVELAR
jgi:hypothetical protein